MEKSSFFNSVQASDGSYDREYLAEDFARYFASFIGNGVFPNPSTNLQVLSNNDMTVSIDIGKAFINGYYYENTTKLVKTIDVADGVLNRIDLVVLRLDFTNREIKTYVKKGTFTSSPKAQSLQRDSDMYELALAEVYISAGATTITQGNITDLRLDNNSCGVVHGVVDQVDTTTIFNQYLAWYEEKSAEFKANLDNKDSEFTNDIKAKEEEYKKAFEDWFNRMKDQLSTDAAGNLQIQIDKKTENKNGTGTMLSKTDTVVIEDSFFTEETFVIVSVDTYNKWTWKTEQGKLTITSDSTEYDDVSFSYCAIKGGD